MLNLIIGKKGSGKTKKLIDAVTGAAEKSNGNVVCVEKGPTLTYNISHKIRLIDADIYKISGYDKFYGFLAGICASNHDVTNVFVDATLRIGSRDYNELAEFLKKINWLAADSKTEFTFTISCDESELPAEIFEVAEKLN